LRKFKKDFTKKKKIIKDYNSTSSFYDRRYKKIQKQKLDLILKDFILDEKIIIDAGCGTGLLFEFLILDKGVEKRFSYVGTDISWEMLKQFSQKLENLKKRMNVNLILSDIEYLPLRGKIFRSIFSITSFQNLANIKFGLDELIRTAKNEAEFKLSILKKNLNLNKFMKSIKAYLQDIELTDIEELEDFIIQGLIFKKNSKNLTYRSF
jgi:ubiquinone/menaquinone biosynthesis C-methylase UbiE